MTKYVRTDRCLHAFGSCFKFQGGFLFFYRGSYLQYNFLDAFFPLVTWDVFVHAQKSLGTKIYVRRRKIGYFRVPPGLCFWNSEMAYSVIINFTIFCFLRSGLRLWENSLFCYSIPNHVNLWQSLIVYTNQLLQNSLYPWKPVTFLFLCKKIQHAKSLLASRPLETSQIRKTFVIRTHDPFITLPIRAEQALNPNGSC